MSPHELIHGVIRVRAAPPYNAPLSPSIHPLYCFCLFRRHHYHRGCELHQVEQRLEFNAFIRVLFVSKSSKCIIPCAAKATCFDLLPLSPSTLPLSFSLIICPPLAVSICLSLDFLPLLRRALPLPSRVSFLWPPLSLSR